MSSLTWKDKLESQISPEMAREIDQFEAQMHLRKQWKIEERVFAEAVWGGESPAGFLDAAPKGGFPSHSGADGRRGLAVRVRGRGRTLPDKAGHFFGAGVLGCHIIALAASAVGEGDRSAVAVSPYCCGGGLRAPGFSRCG